MKVMLKIWMMLVAYAAYATDSYSQTVQPNGFFVYPSSKNFSEINPVNPLTIFVDHAVSFGIGEGKEMRLVRLKQGKTGKTYRFQCLYKGLVVEGYEAMVFAKDQFAKKVYFKVPGEFSIDTTPFIDEVAALNSALNFINASLYFWDDSQLENELKAVMNDLNATYFPKAELKIINTEADLLSGGETSGFELVYAFDVYCLAPFDAVKCYVNAHTSKVVKLIPLINTCGVEATALTKYSGNRTILVSQTSSNAYVLYACNNNDVYFRTQRHNSDNIINPNLLFDADEVRHAYDAHWAIYNAYDYFYFGHARNGHGDNGSGLNIVVDKNFFYANNAAFVPLAGGQIYVGHAIGDWVPLTSVDVIAHEFTHGITRSEAALAYYGESGALNESFSDIFGAMVKYYAKGEETNIWLHADEPLSNLNSFYRSLSNPKSPAIWYNDNYLTEDIAQHFRCGENNFNVCYPNTYLGDYWIPTDLTHHYQGGNPVFDNGGVHHNSSIQNHWFYLLSEGGTEINDNGLEYEVQGIGKYKASKIAYCNLTERLVSSSNYIEAAYLSYDCAEDLFGECSNEAFQTKNAWAAVGVIIHPSSDNCGIYDASDGWVNVADYQIFAPQVDCSQNQMTIESGGAVTFKANVEIILGDGFTAEAGSYFHAFISPCDEGIGGDPPGRIGSGDTGQFHEIHAPKNKSKPEISLYPNPYSHEVTFSFVMPESGAVTVKVSDMLGRVVAVPWENKAVSAGVSSWLWDGSGLSDGVYVVSVSAGPSSHTLKLIKAGK